MCNVVRHFMPDSIGSNITGRFDFAILANFRYQQIKQFLFIYIIDGDEKELIKKFKLIIPDIEVFYGDITNPNDIKEAIKDQNPNQWRLFKKLGIESGNKMK